MSTLEMSATGDAVDECCTPSVTGSGVNLSLSSPAAGNVLRHRHGASCGHSRWSHEEHFGYLHDGRLHCLVNGKTEEHPIELSNEQMSCSTVAVKLTEAPPAPTTAAALMAVTADSGAGSSCGGGCHRHSDSCGHERVFHQDHFDYLVEDSLHHAHDDHCDVHGKVVRIKKITLNPVTEAASPPAEGEEEEKAGLLVTTTPKSSSSAGGVASLFARRCDVPDEAMADAASGDKGSVHGWQFLAMVALTTTFMLVELSVGVWLGSLALYADAIHMLSDLISLIIGFYSFRVATRPRSSRASFGFSRMEVVGSLVNSVFLLALCLSIFIDTLQRFAGVGGGGDSDSLRAHALVIVGVACGGLCVNLGGMLIFGGHGHSHSHGGGGHGHSHSHGHSHAHGDHGHSAGHGHSHASGRKNSDGDVDSEEHGHSHAAHGAHGHAHSHAHEGGKARSEENLNMRAQFVHVAGDALGQLGVIVSGLIMYFVDSPAAALADPLCSLFITAVIVAGTVPVTKEAAAVLLHQLPEEFDVERLRTELASVVDKHPALLAPAPAARGVAAGVVPIACDIHELHVWQINPRKSVCTVHLTFSAPVSSVAWMALSDAIKLRLHALGIHSSTLQPEFIDAKLTDAAAVATGALQSLESRRRVRCQEPLCASAGSGSGSHAELATTAVSPASSTSSSPMLSAATKQCLANSCCAAELKLNA
jgi:zinc transporter 1